MSDSKALAERFRIGTAGWAIPRDGAAHFPSEGSVLQRYASVLDAAEINSSFHLAHLPQTYERWADVVGATFRFAVKLPKAITHQARLIGAEEPLRKFLGQVQALGSKLGALLIQLPPSFAFNAEVVGPFCRRLSDHSGSSIVCEPRHASWFNAEVDQWLAHHHIARVAADPARHPGAGTPGGWRDVSYYRLHGSPRVYYSAYGREALASLAVQVARDEADTVWCVFDNTASGEAIRDALQLRAALRLIGL